MENAIQSVLGRHAAVACLNTTDGNPALLTPEEYVAVSGAIAKRQNEFAAGRMAARRAMHRIGFPSTPLLANPDRSPRWPQHLVGSISHSQTSCVAIVARREHLRSIGVDVEPDRELPPELWDLICHPEELQRAAELPQAVRARWVTRVFCAKEAYYKWVYPQIRCLMAFHDVTIELNPTLDNTIFIARPLRREAREATPAGLTGTLTITQDTVISLVTY